MKKRLICEVELEKREISFTLEWKGVITVLRGLPAYFCTSCGEEMLDRETSSWLDYEIENHIIG